MAGNNDRIHGYNEIYRTDNQAINFYSFDLQGVRPTNFIYRPVHIINAAPPASDHQGHIVPQNILNLVLDPLMDEMAAACDNLAEVNDFIATHQPWLALVLQYGTFIGAPMFDFDENDPEMKLGGFFSIITWNPVNICRAPEDNRRGGVPGNTIDTQVVEYLENNQVEQGVNAEWLASLQVLLLNQDNDVAINEYIASCSATLGNQEQQGIGYYAFDWENTDNVLSPIQM